MKKIIAIVLINGIEIIGETDSDLKLDDPINIYDPVEVKDIMLPNGACSIIAQPFMTYSRDKIFTIKQKHVITYTRVETEVEKYYKDIKKYVKTNTPLSADARDKLYSTFKLPKDGIDTDD